MRDNALEISNNLYPHCEYCVALATECQNKRKQMTTNAACSYQHIESITTICSTHPFISFILHFYLCFSGNGNGRPHALKTNPILRYATSVRKRIVNATHWRLVERLAVAVGRGRDKFRASVNSGLLEFLKWF